MLAILAAVFFGLAVLLDLANADLGDNITLALLVNIGLFCVALHLAGVGAGRALFRRR
jgi:hypothetical protein